jgi:AcrR family transcriptional regulator
MMSATSSPTEAPAALTPAAAATRAAIIEVAERLFRTFGYQKTTVADIARELRMSPANIYRFFPSKAAINEAMCSRILAELDAAVWDAARGPGSPPDRIRAMFRLLQEQTIALFFQERRMHDMVAAALEEHWPVIKQHINAIDSAFAHVVREGQAAGVFAPIDPDQAGRLLHGTCPLFTHPTLVQQCRETENLAELAQGMAEFCLRALRPQ